MTRLFLFMLWLVTSMLLLGVSGSVPASMQRNVASLLVRGGIDTNHHQSGLPDLLQETVLHDGWRRLLNRKVQFPSGQIANFEVVGQRGTDQAVVIFAWHSETKCLTCITEYMPSVQKSMIGLPAGMIEDHHAKVDEDDMVLEAAKCELEEECRLKGGVRWIKLTEEPVVMDKYSTTRISVFLVIDPMPIHESVAKERDATEEGMQILPNVSVEQLRKWIARGKMTVVGSWASLLALEKLRELGELSL